MTSVGGRAALRAIVVLALATPVAGQTRPDPCTQSPANPPDVSFELSLTNGQATFREGEIIGLTLAFSSSSAGKYALNTRDYDRIGRLHAETFCLAPSAGRDPLDDYFNSGLGGLGGLGGYQTLTTTPAAVRIELNEWRALPPGSYRLRLASHRIERGAAPGEPGSGIVSLELWSNPVEFAVTRATPDWQAAQLAAATSAVDSAKDDASRRNAARVLRFLGSEAATRELVRRFAGIDQRYGAEFRFGILGSPHRQIAIEAMRAAIADPSGAITREFISTLARLDRQAIGTHYAALSAALPAKIGVARAIAVNTLATAPEGTVDRSESRRMLISSWDTLPLDTRNELLQYRWQEIAGPEMVPILRRIVDIPVTRGRAPDQPERGPALARLYELDPVQGREVILREMLNPRGDIGIGVLGRLPDRELAEIEAPILARLHRGNGGEIAFQLLERYGSSGALAELKGIYQPRRGRWACAPQAAMLRYFLRVERSYGVAEVADALGRRGVTGCYRSVLTQIGEALALPEVERVAIAALDDESMEVARSAAEALARHGSAAAEAALWQRLERFHNAWKDRYDALRPGPVLDEQNAAANMLEYALLRAIAGGAGWLAGADTLERLVSLSSPARRTEFASHAAAWRRGSVTLTLSWLGDGRVFYSLATYSGDRVDRLVDKLRQFPPGTRVQWTLRPDLADRHRPDVDALLAAARAAGVVLEMKTP